MPRRKSKFGLAGMTVTIIIISLIVAGGIAVAIAAGTGAFSPPAPYSSAPYPSSSAPYSSSPRSSTPSAQSETGGSGTLTSTSNDCTCRTSWAYRNEDKNPAAGYMTYRGCDSRAPDSDKPWCYVTGTTQAACPGATLTGAEEEDLEPGSQERQDRNAGKLFYRNCP